jgi:hypothetical protein
LSSCSGTQARSRLFRGAGFSELFVELHMLSSFAGQTRIGRAEKRLAQFTSKARMRQGTGRFLLALVDLFREREAQRNLPRLYADSSTRKFWCLEHILHFVYFLGSRL